MGFAAEIKEFLGAAKDSWKLMSDTELKDAQTKYTATKAAAEQKEMDDPLNQQLKEAKLAHMQATTGQIGKETPLDALRRQALQLEIDAAKAPPPPYGPATTAQPAGTSGGYNAPVIAAPQRGVDPNASTGTLFGTEQAPRTYGYGGAHAKGGLVKKFAVGGVVEDEDLEDDEVTPEVTRGATLPAVGGAAPVGAGGYDIGAQRRPAAVGGVPLPQRKPDALTDGLKYGANQIARLPAIGPARQRGVRGYAQGAGGAPPDDMIQVYRKIDPEGKMGESERNLAAIQAVWQYKQNQGDTEGAAKAAFQMMQYYKTAQTRYGALAAAALKEGHTDEGLKLAMRQYANIPDGNDIKLYRGRDGRIGYEMKDKDGNPISGGIATPEEIGAAAAKLASPGGFENHLVQQMSGAKVGGRTIGAGAGGKKGEEEEVEGAAGAGFKTSKPSEYKELKQEQIDQSVNTWHDAMKKDPKSKGLELTPKELAGTKNMLFHLRANNQITDDEGLRRIQTIIRSPEPLRGEPPPFRAVENKEAKTTTLMFPDGGELIIPNTQVGMFKSARVEHFKEQADIAAEAARKAARPSGWAMAEGAAEDFEVKRKKWAEGMDESAKDLYNKSTLGAVGRGAGRVVDEASKWLGTAGKTISEKGGAGAIGAGVRSALGGGEATAAPVNPDDDRPLP